MIDLRFVERDGKKILQWRVLTSNADTITPITQWKSEWSEWEDVRTEKEE